MSDGQTKFHHKTSSDQSELKIFVHQSDQFVSMMVSVKATEEISKYWTILHSRASVYHAVYSLRRRTYIAQVAFSLTFFRGALS